MWIGPLWPCRTIARAKNGRSMVLAAVHARARRAGFQIRAGRTSSNRSTMACWLFSRYCSRLWALAPLVVAWQMIGDRRLSAPACYDVVRVNVANLAQRKFIFLRRAVLRLGVEIASVVPFVQLARWLTVNAVDHPSSPDCRPLHECVSPTTHILVVLHAQELGGSVENALGQRAIPREDGHISDRVDAARDVLTFREATLEDV